MSSSGGANKGTDGWDTEEWGSLEEESVSSIMHKFYSENGVTVKTSVHCKLSCIAVVLNIILCSNIALSVDIYSKVLSLIYLLKSVSSIQIQHIPVTRYKITMIFKFNLNCLENLTLTH